MSIFLPLVVLFHSSPLLSSSPTRRASPGEEGEEWGIRVKRLVTGRKTCDRSCPGFTVPFGHLSSRHPRSAHPFRSSVRRFLRHFVSLLTPFTRVAIPFPHALRRYAHRECYLLLNWCSFPRPTEWNWKKITSGSFSLLLMVYFTFNILLFCSLINYLFVL